MEGAQAAGVLAQALRDGEEQFAGAVAQRAHQKRRVAQVPGVRLVRHLAPAQSHRARVGAWSASTPSDWACLLSSILACASKRACELC